MAAMIVSSAIPPSQLRLSVAPMMDWTDTHCRVFHRVLAPHARLYTEMVHANAVIHGDRARLLALDPIEHPVALQLGGSEPELLAQAAQIGAEHGFDEINLNCGCPSDRVQAGRFGACLMREPALVADSVAAMIGAACRRAGDGEVPARRRRRPRLGSFPRLHRYASPPPAAACSWSMRATPGCKGCRRRKTAKCRRCATTGRTGSSANGRSCRSSSTAASPAQEEATQHLEHADGAMLGRAAYHDPYLLHRLDVAWFGGAAAHARRTAARLPPVRRSAARARRRTSSTSPATCSACSPASAAAARSARCSAKARTSRARTGRWSSRRLR